MLAQSTIANVVRSELPPGLAEMDFEAAEDSTRASEPPRPDRWP